jgi:hypothetical protein
MRLKLILPLLILLCAVSVLGQDNKCALKLSELPDAPELFGFRMGMSTAQVKLRVPQVVFGRANEFGLSKTSFSPDFDPQIDKASLSGIRTVSLDFLDGHLTSLWLGFDGSFKWQTVPDFIKGISQSLQLPDVWTVWKIRGQQLRCADFQMTVSIVAEGPSFHIIDQTAEQTMAARRVAREQQDEAIEEAEQGQIIADKHAKVYYFGRCQGLNEIKEENRIVFETREEAEKGGYKAAKNCQ